MLVASTSVVGFGFGSGEAQHGQMFPGLPPKADFPILELLPPPALSERRHRGQAVHNPLTLRFRRKLDLYESTTRMDSS